MAGRAVSSRGQLGGLAMASVPDRRGQVAELLVRELTQRLGWGVSELTGQRLQSILGHLGSGTLSPGGDGAEERNQVGEERVVGVRPIGVVVGVGRVPVDQGQMAHWDVRLRR